jgi:hypothetical protein
MKTLTLRARLLLTIAGTAVIATTPIGLELGKAGWTVAPGYAFAKDGRDDDSGGHDSDERDDDSDRDDDGGRDDDSGRDDDGEDRDDDSNEDRGSGGGRDDSDGDRGGSDDDSDEDEDEDDDEDSGRSGDDDRAGRDDDDDRGGARVEISRNGIEVENLDGTKEEIENGRYERKDAAGRTVEERPATQADVDRLRGLAGVSGATATRRVSAGSVARVELRANGIEVLHNDGTQEEIENGRYERKDAAGRTVEERPATQADVDRLQLVSRSARANPVRRIEVGAVARVERSAARTEILYTTGWREELENGRYELKDPNGNTVVERIATPRDTARIARFAR